MSHHCAYCRIWGPDRRPPAFRRDSGRALRALNPALHCARPLDRDRDWSHRMTADTLPEGYISLPFTLSADGTFDAEGHLKQFAERIFEAEEKLSHGILREAFESGVEWAQEREYVAEEECVSPDFDTWLAEVKERLVA